MRRILLGPRPTSGSAPMEQSAAAPSESARLPRSLAMRRSTLSFRPIRRILARSGDGAPIRNPTTSLTAKHHLEGTNTHVDNRSRPS